MSIWPVVMPSLEDLAETAADITPVRGDLLVVNSSTLWDDFAVGAAGSILTSNGTDPAWDTTPVISGTLTLSGMTQGSVLFLGSGGLVSEDNTNLFWDNTNNRLGIGTNAPTHDLDIHGHMEMTHVADEAGDHAIEIDLDAAGFGDTKGLAINYVTGAIGTGKDEAIILLNINEISAAGGDISGLEVLSTSGSADLISGLKVGVLVGPILQSSGAFINPTTGTNNTASTDVADMIDGSTGTNTTIFVADNDFIIIGAAAAFGEIEFVIETGAANPGIKPTFGYSTTGSGQFTTFSPVDGTNGFRSTGVVAWESDDLTGHTTNNDTGTFDIKITRTHAVAGSVSLFYAKTAATDVYKWDKDGKITCNDLTIGIGKAGIDYKLTFDGESNDGVLTWLEDELQFSFDRDIVTADNTGIVVGHTAQIDFGATPEFQVLGTATPDSSMGFARFENNASGPDVRFLKSRGGSIGTNVLVQDDDTLGRFRFQGADGIDFNTTAAEILGRVNGTPTGNDIPGEIVFRTRVAAGSLADRLIVDNAGVVSVLTGNLVMTDNSITGINSLTFTGVTGAIDNSGSSLLFTTATIATLAWTWVVPGIAMAVQNTTDAASNQVANFFSGNRAGPTDNDEGFLSFSNDNSAGAQTEFSRLTWKALDVSSSTKDSQIELAVMVNNSLTDMLTVANTGLISGLGLTVAGDIVMADNSVTGINTLTFNDTAGTIAGIQNQNLLDKTATETVSGVYTFTADPVISSTTPTLTFTDTTGSAESWKIDVDGDEFRILPVATPAGDIVLDSTIDLYPNAADSLVSIISYAPTYILNGVQHSVLKMQPTITVTGGGVVVYRGVDVSGTMTVTTEPGFGSAYALMTSAMVLTSATAGEPPSFPVSYLAEPITQSTDNDVGSIGTGSAGFKDQSRFKAITNADAKLTVALFRSFVSEPVMETDTVGAEIVLTERNGLHVADITLTGANGTKTLVDNYGIRIDDLTNGTADYGIRVDGADTQVLWLSAGADNTDAANGIAFGATVSTQAKLYRSANNQLKTDGSLVVDQSSATGAVPVLTIDQADVSEEMIEFISTIGTGNAIEAVGAKSLTTTHFIKVTIPGGLTRYVPCGTIA